MALAQAVDHRADIYSLGCLLYEMLAGAPPFEGRSVVEVVNKHIQEQPLPMRQRRPDLDIAADVDAVVTRVLDKDPDRRFATMTELCAALDQCRTPNRLIALAAEGVAAARGDEHRPPVAPKARPERKPRGSWSARRVARATLIAALFCGAAAAMYGALHGF